MSWCLTTSVLRLLLAQQEMQSQRLFITQYQMEDMATSSSVHGLLPQEYEGHSPDVAMTIHSSSFPYFLKFSFFLCMFLWVELQNVIVTSRVLLRTFLRLQSYHMLYSQFTRTLWGLQHFQGCHSILYIKCDKLYSLYICLLILQFLGHLHLLLQSVHDINNTEDRFSSRRTKSSPASLCQHQQFLLPCNAYA